MQYCNVSLEIRTLSKEFLILKCFKSLLIVLDIVLGALVHGDWRLKGVVRVPGREKT